jgi:urea transporter
MKKQLSKLSANAKPWMILTKWSLKMPEKFRFLNPFLLAYTSTFILGRPLFGLFLFLLTLLQPNVGVAGFLGLLFCAFYLRLLQVAFDIEAVQSAFRNCLLVGLLVGNLFALNLQILFFLAIFIFLTLALTVALETIFAAQKLSSFSLPFCLVALIIFILLSDIYKFSHFPLSLWKFDITGFLPDLAVYFFHALSSLFSITDPSVGLLIWIGIALASPLTALFFVLGFVIGTATESILHSLHHELFFYAEGYNYCLIFAAVAGLLMVPSRLSLLLATFSTMMTAVIILASGAILNPWHLPVLSLPFNLMLSLIFLMLKTLRPRLLNQTFFASPEHNIETLRLLWKRHRFPEIGVFLPVSGLWKVQQAFNGSITHRGLWQHALDFVAVDAEGKIFTADGHSPKDHFSFGKTVLAPVEGYVTDCIGSDEDNAIGQISDSRNWGNYVIIKSRFYSFYVVLCHLKKDSLAIKKGDLVQAGQKLAECGNSGYSQEPHLHLQVQYQPEIGAATAPFHLINYAIAGRIHFHRPPLLNEILHSLNFNHALEQILNFKIEEKMVFCCNEEFQITITPKMDEKTGNFYLTDGISKLFYAKIGAQFYFYGLKAAKHSALWDLLAAAPKIPLTCGQKLEYNDELPLILTQNSLKRFYSYLKQICGFSLKNNQGKYSIDDSGFTIYGFNKSFAPEIGNSILKIDPLSGIKEFSVANRSYVRIFS